METDVLRPPPAAASRYQWWVVAMLWCVCFFNYADRQAIFSVFPKLKEEFGFDKVQLGLIGSAFMWVYAGASPLAGFIGDRFRRKDLILGGCLFWSFVTLTTAWAQKLWQFVAVRAAEGFGEAFYFPASMSLVSDYHPRRTRSRAMSFHQSSVYLGTIGGGWLGGLFAEQLGWRTGFYVFGACGMILAIVLYKFLREPQRGQSDLKEAIPAQEEKHVGASRRVAPEGESPIPTPPTVSEVLHAIFRSPTAVLLMAAFVGANFVAATFLTWTPTFLVEKFQFKLGTAGLTGTLFIHLASAVSVPLAGWLADWLSRRLAGGRILVQAVGLIVGAPFVFLVGQTNELSTLLAVMTVFGLCKGLYDANIFASLYDVVHPRARATAAGVMNTVGWTGGALAPVTIGWLAKRGGQANEVANMSQAISFGGAIYLAAASLLLVAILVFARRDVVPQWENERL
jgi:MFS family permease